MTMSPHEDEPLERELRDAARGLTFMSESDYPLEVFRWDARVEVSPDYLRELAGEDSSTPVETKTVEEFFRASTSEPDWKGAAEIETARKYQALLRLIRERLTDPKAYRVGGVNAAVYVAGRGPSGAWLGVSTRVVET
jgi:hypothetical protein